MTFRANETVTIPTANDAPARHVRSRRHARVMRHRNVGVRISGFGV